ncbi:MAG: hypothetical protein OXF93_23795 [Acidobacteria bacterium]|nr:hypothetical protein [Acidobacteriota bacterium]
MHARHAVAGVLAAAVVAGSLACGRASALDPDLPEIVARSIAYHGGALYQSSRMSMTITSLSGSFGIEALRDGDDFEYVVTNPARGDRPERRVRLTNEGVTEWVGGVESELDGDSERRATAFVNARVFFPLLPYTLNGGDIHFEDQGLDRWAGRDLHRVKVWFTPGTSNDADDAYTFWFDPETGRIEQFGYDFDNGLRFRRATSFERVGGVLFSDQDNYAVDGGKIPVDTLTPDYVVSTMRLLSQVSISDVTVEPL